MMIKIVKTILKWIVMVWSLIWGAFAVYAAIGAATGMYTSRRCDCGGMRLSSRSKLFKWLG